MTEEEEAAVARGMRAARRRVWCAGRMGTLLRRRERTAATVVLVVVAVLLPAAGCSGGGEEPAGPQDGGEHGGATGHGRTDPPAAGGSAEVVRTVAEGLDSPWGVARLPGGDLLVGSRDGGSVHEIAVASGEVTEAGEVPGVRTEGEGGLLGLAPGPDFTEDGFLYAYYTTAGDNRISRFRYAPQAPPGERLVPDGDVLTGIPRGEVIHHGGGLALGPDGMLYAATGDTGKGRLAQDAGSLAGKILRMDPRTGEPPPGNPVPGSLVYSSGHRNVQGLAWDDEGRMWASEFGENDWDELNRIVPGGNYGWPEHEGRGGADEGFRDPVAQWPTGEASPSGLAFTGGSLWMAALRGERLWRIPLDGAEPAAEPRAFLEGEYGRLRSVLPAGAGELYLVTNETDTRGTPEEGDDRVLLLRVS